MNNSTNTPAAPMTEQELAEIEARADAATPGPWCRSPTTSIDQTVTSDHRTKGLHTLFAELDGTGPGTRSDADFIAAARDDVPRLVAEVRRLRGEVATEREACAQVADECALRHARDGKNPSFCARDTSEAIADAIRSRAHGL